MQQIRAWKLDDAAFSKVMRKQVQLSKQGDNQHELLIGNFSGNIQHAPRPRQIAVRLDTDGGQLTWCDHYFAYSRWPLRADFASHAAVLHAVSYFSKPNECRVDRTHAE